MKKILFLTTRLIYPVNDGRKVVIYNYCKGLVEQHNCEVRLFPLVNEEERKIKQPNFISKVYFGDLPSMLEKIKNTLIKSLILRKWPLQVSVYYSKSTKGKLDKVIEEYNPDIVISDMARTSEYLRDLDIGRYNKILDMDDLLSKRYYRQLKSNVISSNSIGAYSERLPNVLKKLTGSNYIMRKVIRTEADLLAKYEVDIANHYKSIIFVSAIEAEEFNKKIKSNKSIDISIGVDYEYFSEKLCSEKRDNHIVFLGNMFVAHNKDSISMFLKNVFPLILRKNPNCILRIVGKCPDEYKKTLESYKNVEVTGEVDDIRKYVQECSVSIAPLKYGTGIKTKILETMAMGVPVVTNDIGNEGLISLNNKHIIIENNDELMAKKINELLKDKKMQSKIVNEANKFIQINHSWNLINEKFSEIL